MSSYVVHRGPDFHVRREGVLLIIRQLSVRGSDTSVEVTLQGGEGYDLERSIEKMEAAECEPTVIDYMLSHYF